MILLYFSSDLHTRDEVVLPTGDGLSGQQTYLLEKSAPKTPAADHVALPTGEGPSGQQNYLLEQSDPKSPQGPSGQQTKLLDQSPMGPFEGHQVHLTASSVSRQILQSPTVVKTPERRLSREALL